MQETPVWFLVWEAPLEKGWATHSSILGLPWWLRHKESSCNGGDLCSIPGLEKIPWRRAWWPTPVPCLENPHGQRSLAGCSPWGHKDSDTTKWLGTTQHRELVQEECGQFTTVPTIPYYLTHFSSISCLMPLTFGFGNSNPTYYNCKWVDSIRLSGDKTHILCFTFSLKYLDIVGIISDNSVWCTFPELFYRCWNPHQMEDINYLMTINI